MYSSIKTIKIDNFVELNLNNSSSGLKILNIPLKFKSLFNVKSKEISQYILKSLSLANELAKKDKIKGFVNCSTNKKNVFGSSSLGVTEYLANKNTIRNSEVMMIYNNKFSVVPITTHISVCSTRSVDNFDPITPW